MGGSGNNSHSSLTANSDPSLRVGASQRAEDCFTDPSFRLEEGKKTKKRTKPDFQTGSYHRESPKIGAATRGSREGRNTRGLQRRGETERRTLHLSDVSDFYPCPLCWGGGPLVAAPTVTTALFSHPLFVFPPTANSSSAGRPAVVRTARGPDVHEEQLEPNTSSHFRVGVLLTSAQSSPHLGP